MSKTNTPLVTVAMVTYNSEPYVRMAIDSVLASNYINFELIISDDCSTDNTWEIIQEYKDSRIRAYRNEQNIREYPNRKKCIELANGKYLIFIDGDDYIYPHGLQSFVSFLIEFPKSAMAIARPESDHMIYPVEIEPEDFLSYHFFGKSLANQGFPSTMFKTEIIRALGDSYFEYIAGDTFIKLMIGAQYKSLMIHDGLIWWRKTPGQASEKLNIGVVGFKDYVKIHLYILNKKRLWSALASIAAAEMMFYSNIRKQLITMSKRMQFGSILNVLINCKLDIRLLLFTKVKKLQEFKLSNSSNPLFSHRPNLPLSE